MSYKEIKFGADHQVVYDLLTRSKNFHTPVGSTLELDITDLDDQIKSLKLSGHKISLVSFLVKATALLIKKNPKLNQHLFHGLFSKKIIQFDDIICTTIVERKDNAGNPFLLPLNIKNPQDLELSEIYELIKKVKTMPYEELPEVKSFNKLRKLPLWAIKLFSYKVRSDPDFYIKYFGTYGLSSLLALNSPAIAANSLCNTGVAFIPGTIKDRAVVIKGEIQIRKMLSIYVMFDHYLMNGVQMHKAVFDFQKMIEKPSFLPVE